MNKVVVTNKGTEIVKMTQEEIDLIQQPVVSDLNYEYKESVKVLVSEKYSIEEEIGLVNDCNEALINQQSAPQEYLDYRTYVNECKDKAYLKVYGTNR